MLHQDVARAPSLPLGASAPKVYSYARWSTPEQAKGDSNRRQAEAAAKWAEKNGLELDLSLKITDEGVSAYRGGNAVDGGLSRFLEACRLGLIESGSFLLVESLDRISRMVPRRAQSIVNEIVDNGVTIVTLNDDQHYSAERLDNDPTALIISLMVAWRAHEESKTKGRRVAEAWNEKRRRVRENPQERLTRRGPSWLTPTADGWTRDPDRTATVQRIYALTLGGVGEHKIAAMLNSEGVPVLCKGKHWHRSTVAKVLRNPAVIGTLIPGHIRYIDGQRHHVKEEPIPNAFPAVISEADWVAVRALKDGKGRVARGRHAGKPAAVHLFAGLGKCPACGSAMIRVNKGSLRKGGLPKLVCSAAKTKAGCRYVSVRVAVVETALLNNWGNLFASVPADDPSGELDDQYTELEGAIFGTEDHLDYLAETFRRQRLPTIAREMGRLEAELKGMRVRLEELDERRRMADRGLIRARMEELHGLLDPVGPVGPQPFDRTAINARLNVLFEAVVIDYPAGLLRFRWRQGGETTIRYAWVD
jgi:DNA invertase Pin-like site-specific DNA recombinase